MISEIFIILGALVLFLCLFLFIAFRKAIKMEFGVLSKSIKLINNIFHILVFFFFIGYCIILFYVHGFNTDNTYIFILSQILFWGSIFVAITIVLLRIMLQNIVQAKLNQIDNLTSLYTKIAGNCKIEELLSISKYPIHLAILDLDNFKKINDIYGHLKGDELLVEVSKAIKEKISADEIACRFGGDEFVICLINRKEHNAFYLLNEIKDSINTISNNYREAKLAASIGFTYGIGTGAGGKNTYSEMMQNADKALYHVKKNGKNAVHLYSEEEAI